MLSLFSLNLRRASLTLQALAFACALFWTSLPARAQAPAQTEGPQTPTLSTDEHVNDFAAVIDTETHRQLESILSALKRQAGIEFAVVTVKTTGGEKVFDYSLKVARGWGIKPGAGGKRNALLLLVSTEERDAVAQFSRTLAAGLPEGLIGEMISRTRAPLGASKFTEALMSAVQTIAATLAAQRGLKIEGVDERYAYGVVRPAAAPGASATAAATTTTDAPAAAAPAPAEKTGPEKETVAEKREPSPVPKRRRAASSRRSATTAAKESAAANAPAETPVEKQAGQDSSPVRNSDASAAPATASNNAETAAAAERPAAPAKPLARATAASDDPERREIQAALVLAPAERIEKLKAFIEAHPTSPLKTRASELIVSAHAALGDEKLKGGDTTGGIEQFRLAIKESTPEMSDQLFAEVVSEIPLNLFVRGERAAAIETARLVEEKAKTDARRLLALADFYLGVEDAESAARVSELAVKLAPEMAAAHQALGASRRISLRLEDAAAEYARAVELDAKAASARRSLADLRRATGKAEDALALYREQLKADAADRAARAGVVLSLFDLGKRAEAETELEAALKDEPRNLSLLVGAAYWYAAHDESARALRLAQAAAALEPRYTWAHIALARSLVQLNRPLEAERSLRFARQYGRFPTLTYELATALAAAGLYEEAAEELSRSFSLKDGEIQTQLAGRNEARAADFIELLAPERRASIFQPTAADSPANARMLKGLLALGTALRREKVSEAEVSAAVKDFTTGEDAMRAYRQLYAASQLVGRGAALSLVQELTDAATTGIDAALSVPVATVAVQAEELRSIRAQGLASGATPAIPEAPRNVLSNLLRGRLEDLAGWALFNQDKVEQSIVRLRRAVSVVPEGTPASQSALWHLGTALAASGNAQEALTYYYKSYRGGLPDPARRAIIEALYRKVNGSLDGLEEKIGPAPKG